jgi:hypothetical protein
LFYFRWFLSSFLLFANKCIWKKKKKTFPAVANLLHVHFSRIWWQPGSDSSAICISQKLCGFALYGPFQINAWLP